MYSFAKLFAKIFIHTLSPNAVTNQFSHYMVTTSHFKPTTDQVFYWKYVVDNYQLSS